MVHCPNDVLLWFLFSSWTPWSPARGWWRWRDPALRHRRGSTLEAADARLSLRYSEHFHSITIISGGDDGFPGHGGGRGSTRETVIGDQTPPRHAWIGGFLDVNRDVVLLTCLDIVVSVVASAHRRPFAHLLYRCGHQEWLNCHVVNARIPVCYSAALSSGMCG